MALLCISPHLCVFCGQTQLINRRNGLLLADDLYMRCDSMQHFTEHEIQPTSFPRRPGMVSAPNTPTDSCPSDPGSNDGENAVELVRTCHP